MELSKTAREQKSSRDNKNLAQHEDGDSAWRKRHGLVVNAVLKKHHAFYAARDSTLSLLRCLAASKVAALPGCARCSSMRRSSSTCKLGARPGESFPSPLDSRASPASAICSSTGSARICSRRVLMGEKCPPSCNAQAPPHAAGECAFGSIFSYTPKSW